MKQASRNEEPFVQRMMGLHDDLAQRFFAHQRSLLDRDFVRAWSFLAGYRERLLWHIQDEESLVLPRYRVAGGDETDAPVRLFLGEHQKMREFVADCEQRVKRLVERPDDRLLLELFDREATYKNLVMHHDLRERNALYPFVAGKVGAEELQGILAQLRWSGS
jgi:hemerythrin-like domain-containing protein